MSTEKVGMQLGEKELSIETGKMAKQSHGAAVVRYGDTVVLGTVVASREPKEEVDYLPLFVEYREKTYAAGKIPGGFFKREGRPTEKETLGARLIDRPLRSLFPKGFRNEVQIIVTVLSTDQENDPDMLGIIAASSALALSDIPFETSIGAVKIGLLNGECIICPTHQQIDDGELDLVVAGTKDRLIMVEGEAKEVEESRIFEAIRTGLQEAGQISALIEEFKVKCGKEKRKIDLFKIDPEEKKAIMQFAQDKVGELVNISDKHSRDSFETNLISETSEHLGESPNIKNVIEEMKKELLRKQILTTGKRIDGRTSDELRHINCEVGILPRTHGSALFTRGETQSLAVVTLGTSADEQIIEELKGRSTKSFMLHYNFPPFSVGEIKPVRGPGRREIGHGALAERALKTVLPPGEKFPYTIRIVSDILESNGSSSMATVCGGCLSLMDAGVPIQTPVAGVAMGLIKEGDNTVVLTDINGIEDHMGDMDFKIAGTKQGITTIQMDLKIAGIGIELVEKVLSESLKGRVKIIDEMLKVIPHARDEVSVYAPRIIITKVKQEKIGVVIGPGGRTIKGIIEKTGVEISIEDDGRVFISSNNQDKAREALKIVESLVAEVEIGKVYHGKVKRITDFGAFVEVLPGQDGLVHISKLADHHVKKVEDILKVGDEIKVKVIAVDNQGRINLSKKAVGKENAEQGHEENGKK